MKILKYIASTMLVIILLAGCSEEVLEENPPNILSGPTILKNYNGFEAALNGLYNLARYARWQSEKLENALNGVDNMTSNAKRSDIYWNWTTSNNPSDVDLLQTWQWLYEMINASNTIMYYADKDIDWRGGSDTPENNKLRVVAEARAIRGWAYRRLAYMWGDVPLVLTMPQGIKTDWERTPVAEVRRAVISDYKFAQQYIPEEASLQGRITKGAVQTLLAEMYLTVGKPDSALYWCDQVINNPAYKLTTTRLASDPTGSPFGDMFKEGHQNREQGNKEVLWVFQFELFNSIDEQGHQLSRAEVGTYNSISVKGTDGKSVSPIQYTIERGGRGKAYFSPTKWWVDSYEIKKDDRAQNYILRTSFRIQTQAENNIGYTGTGTLPADKIPAGYKVGDTIWCHWTQDITAARFKVNDWPYSRKAEGTSTADVQADFAWTDQIYIRLADTYLLKAEAQFKLGNLSDVSGAAATINVIRNRSKATPITAAEVTLDYILDERSRELIIEEERRMTLLRTHKWFTRTQLYNKFGGERITLRDTLFPIPQDVIDANLTKPFPQNPGWN